MLDLALLCWPVFKANKVDDERSWFYVLPVGYLYQKPAKDFIELC